jgi:hypothetical protein
MDTTCSGLIGLPEFTAAMQTCGVSPTESTAIFTSLDTHSTGKVNATTDTVHTVVHTVYSVMSLCTAIRRLSVLGLFLYVVCCYYHIRSLRYMLQTAFKATVAALHCRCAA